MSLLQEGDDFGNFDAWGIEVETSEARERGLAQVGFAVTAHEAYVRLVEPDDTAPVVTSRVVMMARNKSDITEGVDRIDVGNPLRHDLDIAEPLPDQRHAFMKAYSKGQPVWRMLMSMEGLMPYDTAGDIAVVKTKNDVIYRVAEGDEAEDADIFHRHHGDFTYPKNGFGYKRGELDALGLIWRTLIFFGPRHP